MIISDFTNNPFYAQSNTIKNKSQERVVYHFENSGH